MLRLGGGLPLGEQFRSLERSLGSECSPATSYGTHEGGDDLEGITQANVERNQQMYVRYSGMSEGEHATPPPCSPFSPSRARRPPLPPLLLRACIRMPPLERQASGHLNEHQITFQAVKRRKT